MRIRESLLAAACVALTLAPAGVAAPLPGATPAIVYTGSLLPDSSADGGLRLAVGVENIEVYRANRTHSEHQDHLTDTYSHQPMLAWWQGNFYLLYLSGPRDESQAPCCDSLTSSPDGIHWAQPRIIFPSIRLPDGTLSIMHQRMAFHITKDGRLLALGFHGKAPDPVDGTGVGRVVREIHEDGSFGPIYFIRYGAHSPWKERNPTYPFYKASPDAGFVADCDAILANRLLTQQWWEEDQKDDTGFFGIHGKAMSYIHRLDGSAVAIWKNALVAATPDEGRTWGHQMQAGAMPNNASKYWLQHLADGRYGLFLNPTNRLRQPLAVMTSDDCVNFGNLLTVVGEAPDQRFPGAFKNLGPQYTRGIAEGNGRPPDADAANWICYSVNKEDIWVSRVPAPIRGHVTEPVHDNFDIQPIGALPAEWNIYSPVWAPVRIVADPQRPGHALELRDEDPYDYARAIRIFPETHGVKISFDVLAQQTSGDLEIELLDAHGLRPVRIRLAEDGHIWACHEGIWMDAGPYRANRWTKFDLEIPVAPTADHIAVRVDGATPLARPAVFSEPVKTVERLSFRTGVYRRSGSGGQILPGADEKAPATGFLIAHVIIEPQK